MFKEFYCFEAIEENCEKLWKALGNLGSAYSASPLSSENPSRKFIFGSNFVLKNSLNEFAEKILEALENGAIAQDQKILASFPASSFMTLYATVCSFNIFSECSLQLFLGMECVAILCNLCFVCKC